MKALEQLKTLAIKAVSQNQLAALHARIEVKIPHSQRFFRKCFSFHTRPFYDFPSVSKYSFPWLLQNNVEILKRHQFSTTECFFIRKIKRIGCIGRVYRLKFWLWAKSAVDDTWPIAKHRSNSRNICFEMTYHVV